MSFNIKNIDKCKDLPNNQIKLMVDKLNIKLKIV
jgi:hypothetical protein